MNSQPVFGHTLTNNFAAFSMSSLQVLDLSLPDSSRLPTLWLASMHQLQVLAVCSNTLAGALTAHIAPLLKILIIAADYHNPLPCTQPVLHADTLPSVLDRMTSPNPLTTVTQRGILVGKLPAAQLCTLSSTGNFLVFDRYVPLKHIHQLVFKRSSVLKQLCNQHPYLPIPCCLEDCTHEICQYSTS